MKGLTTGELARRGGVNVESIRFYEREGLLPRPPRSRAGYRLFPDEAVRRIRFIKRAQGLGFTLKEIGELLLLRAEPGTSCSEFRRRAESKLADINVKIRSLRSMERVLRRLTAACPSRGPVSDCPILESLEVETTHHAVALPSARTVTRTEGG